MAIPLIESPLTVQTEPTSPNDAHAASAPASNQRALRRICYGTSVVLWVLAFIVTFGDIGFDHPGRYGLDFDDFLLLAALYVVVSVVTIVASLISRERRTIALVIASVILPVLLAIRIDALRSPAGRDGQPVPPAMWEESTSGQTPSPPASPSVSVADGVQWIARSPAPAGTRLTPKDAVVLANREAMRKGYNLADFEIPVVEYESVEKEKTWTVSYEGRQPRRPGKHFLVWVRDDTGECQLMPGE
jgi:hypothetical protein